MAAPRRYDSWTYVLAGVAVLAVLVLAFTAWHQNRAANIIHEDRTGLVYGNPKGEKVVVEFFDYQCPYCPETHRRFAEALKSAPDVKLIVRPFSAINENSRLLAAYMMAANLQGKGVTLHNAIIDQKLPVNKDRFLDIASQVGIDVARMQVDADNDAIKSDMYKIEDAALKMGVESVPTYFFDRARYVPSEEMPSVERFRKLLKTAF